MRFDRDKLPLEVDDELARLERIEEAATNLFIPVWRAIVAGQIPDRSLIDDATLTLRDALNPNWPNDSDWLPEPLVSERTQGHIDS